MYYLLLIGVAKKDFLKNFGNDLLCHFVYAYLPIEDNSNYSFSRTKLKVT